MAKTIVILPWDSLVIMTAVMGLTVPTEQEELPAAQVPTNVEQEKEIVTQILTALAV